MRKLPAQLQNLVKALEDTRIGIVLTDRCTNILWVNNVFSQGSGYCRDEVLEGAPGLHPFGTRTGRDCASFWRAVLSVQSWSGEVACCCRTGETKLVRVHVTPLPDVFGRTQFLVGAYMPPGGETDFSADLEALHEAVAAWAPAAVTVE